MRRSATSDPPPQIVQMRAVVVGADALAGGQLGKNNVSLNRSQLAVASAFQKVVAIVAYDEPTEQVQQYAPYTLTVNGVLQPGGTPAQ